MAKSVLTPPNDARTLVANLPVDEASGSYGKSRLMLTLYPFLAYTADLSRQRHFVEEWAGRNS